MADEISSDGVDRLFPWIFGAGLVAAVSPLWAVEYLPMVDLPQHAAQVATWHAWVDGTFGYRDLWEINYRTPYIFSRVLAFLLSHVLSVLDAYRVLLSVAVAGIPLASLLLVRALGGSRWWVLATLPLGYGFTFDWGFVAFTLSVPLGLLHLILSWRYSLEPTRARGTGLWLFTQSLFFAHVFVFGWAGLIAAVFVAMRSDRASTFWRRSLPLLAALPLPALWMVITHGAEAGVRIPISGGYSADRHFQIFSMLIGAERFDAAAVGLGLLLLALPLVVNGRPSPEPIRWMPFVITLSLFYFMPYQIFGTGVIYGRFSIFLLPTWLLALEPRRRPWIHPAVLILPAALALLRVNGEFRGFDREVGRFDEIVAAVEPGSRTLYLGLDPRSEHVEHRVYLHFGQWLQVETGGIVDFSFAEFFPNLFRYRHDVPLPLPLGFEHVPWTFQYDAHHGADYDYFLVRWGEEDPSPVFRDDLWRVELVTSAEGGWWLYRNRIPPPRPAPRSGRAQ